MKSKNGQETEIKFYISNLSIVEKQLLKLGANLQQGRTHEVNWRFDSLDGHLTSTFQVLRLRQDQRVHLAYKGPSDPTSEVSIREEIEFEVSDALSARQFLEALGYQVVVMYEKFRTTYRMEQAEIVLDELPFGNFIEIEGSSPEQIKGISDQLHLNWEARIKLSYLSLFNQCREKFSLKVSNLLFEEFQGKMFEMKEIVQDGLIG